MIYKINIAIIDDCKDDLKIAKYELMKIEALPDFLNVEFKIINYTNPIDFLSSEKIYDFILLDVDMPEMNGFEVAQKINVINPECQIIFLTRRNDRIKEGFKVRAFRYVTKPIDEVEFKEAICSVLNEIKSIGFIEVWNDFNVFNLYIEKILFVEAYGNESKVYDTKEKEFIYKDSLKNLEEILPSWMFFRSHKRFLINLQHYHELNKKDRKCILKKWPHNIEVDVSVRKLKTLNDALHIYRTKKGGR